MVFEFAFIFYAVWNAAAPQSPARMAGDLGASVTRAAFFVPTFRPQTREVTNWRLQAATRLQPKPDFVVDLLLGQTPAWLPRCVKLNNYWCIKRAGWAGEIASDNEGHVAFSSALEGAQTAALLLRRYYVDYGRHSAMAIVSHWAPAQCGLAVGGSIRTLAVRGLGGTLRARWLAAHRAGKPNIRLRPSIVADHSLRMMPTPTIEVGVTEAPLKPVSLSLLAGSDLAPKPAAPRSAGTGACASETQRIASYAAQAAAGIGKVDDDLALFDASGRGTANLARLMANMAGVEIGPLKADASLIAAAIATTDSAFAGAKMGSR